MESRNNGAGLKRRPTATALGDRFSIHQRPRPECLDGKVFTPSVWLGFAYFYCFAPLRTRLFAPHSLTLTSLLSCLAPSFPHLPSVGSVVEWSAGPSQPLMVLLRMIKNGIPLASPLCFWRHSRDDKHQVDQYIQATTEEELRRLEQNIVSTRQEQ